MLSGEAILPFSFCLPSQREVNSERKEIALLGAIFFFII